MIQDIRYAFRLLVRDRAFTFAALVSLAVGIGAATGVFSVVDRILFRAARPRFSAMLLASFAAIGLILSAVRVYGVLGFMVSKANP